MDTLRNEADPDDIDVEDADPEGYAAEDNRLDDPDELSDEPQPKTLFQATR